MNDLFAKYRYTNAKHLYRDKVGVLFNEKQVLNANCFCET